MAEYLLAGVCTAVTNAIFTGVGDLVTKLWDLSLGAFVNLILLGKNAEKLEDEMLQLQELRDDLSGMAEQEALQPMMEVTDQVSGWINRVDNLRQKVATFQDSYGTQSICITGFCLGYDAVQLQRQVDKLIAQRVAFPQTGVVRHGGPIAFEEVALDIPSSSLVGAEKTMRQIQGHIMDDAVGVIGICGMGGAGKTTILKIINNQFFREGEARDMFDLSIWVTVSQTVDILGIQKSIGERLGLDLSGSPREQAKMLSVGLSKKRFILFLDDIWEKIDLLEIGIPCPDESNKHKILFTTRSEIVCREMDAAQIVKVGLLDPEDSWTLFQLKMGNTSAAVDIPDVHEFAKQVVAKCGGLPISLITVGRAMAYATTIQEWRDALRKLDQLAEEVSGMERVLASLKLSFDMLNNSSLQSCLLYCAFYPEDYDIRKGEIIDYWISEGFLDREGYIDTDIGATRDRGHAWIRRLQNACLLQDGNYDKTIKLHDSIRDMLLWIGREKYVMLAGDNRTQIPRGDIWERAKGISLMHNRTRRAPSFLGELSCRALTILLLRSTLFCRTIQEGFFACTRSLRVLDLSRTTIMALPADITTLVELRYLNLSYTQIKSLPEELGKLSNLRYLNLRDSSIASLPEELGKLTNLSYLNLSNTTWLKEIPREAVSRLTSLQVLKMVRSSYINFGPHSKLGLSDLKNLGLLCELSATVGACSSVLHDIAVSNTFSRCIRKLLLILVPDDEETGDGIVFIDIMSLPELTSLTLLDSYMGVQSKLTFGPGHFPKLKFLKLGGFKRAEIVINPVFPEYETGSKQPIFERLQKLEISCCHGLRDLTWVGQLPLLEEINLSDCRKITELLLLDGGDLTNDGRTIFTRLKYMKLKWLPSLRSISKHVLHFPSLEQLEVTRCLNLKRLSFGPESAENLRKIKGEQEWWDGLEWDQPSVKYFLDRFEAW